MTLHRRAGSGALLACVAAVALAACGRTTEPMTAAEEGNSMPKAGQANDHSDPAAHPVPTPRTEPAR